MFAELTYNLHWLSQVFGLVLLSRCDHCCCSQLCHIQYKPHFHKLWWTLWDEIKKIYSSGRMSGKTSSTQLHLLYIHERQSGGLSLPDHKGLSYNTPPTFTFTPHTFTHVSEKDMGEGILLLYIGIVYCFLFLLLKCHCHGQPGD